MVRHNFMILGRMHMTVPGRWDALHHCKRCYANGLDVRQVARIERSEIRDRCRLVARKSRITLRSIRATGLKPARGRRAGLAALLAATALGSCLGVSAVPASAAEVTYQRLLNASSEPQNWLMRMGNYSNWNHSALNAINRGNVANLKVKFMASLGDPSRPNKATEYFTPLVEDGFMYVGNQWHQYWKLDVRNEKPTVVWKFDAKVQGGGKSAHSVTLLGNNVYFNTGNDTSVPRF